MLPASIFTPLYYHAMLLVVFGCSLFYWTREGQARSLTQFNGVAMVIIGVGVLLFIGLRPVSGVFVDMTVYSEAYHRLQNGIEVSLGDRLFDMLMRSCGSFLPVGGFFFLCALIYIAPLAVASWRIHGAWAFPVFLAFLTAFSFWGYGVNGIRNGMATSVLLLAFAFHDQPVVMIPLMAAACGFHGSVLLPAGAFLIVSYIKRTEIWLAFWIVCVAASLVAGNVGEILLSRFNPFAFDNRIESYIVNSGDSGGFRADFLAYSIIPVLVTLLLASPSRARSRRSGARGISKAALNWIGKRGVMGANRMGMRRLAFVQAADPVGAGGGVGFARLNRNPRSGLAGAGKASSGQGVSARRDKMPRSAWGRLPWVRLLRTDPFYARLVNTYLLTNALWALVIHANFSNRFAYLSWFMMPWILVYPFVPGRSNGRPRTGLIAATLCAQYTFTYLMGVAIAPLRGR